MRDSVIIAHHFWDRPGGGELVMASLAVVVDRMGYTPVITSLTKFRKEKYQEWFGIDISRYPVVKGRFNIRAFSLYLKLFMWSPVEKALKRYEPEFVIIDMPTYRPLLKKVRIIEYIHFPLDALYYNKYRSLGFYYKDDPYTAERYRKFPLNIYAWTFLKFIPSSRGLIHLKTQNLY